MLSCPILSCPDLSHLHTLKITSERRKNWTAKHLFMSFLPGTDNSTHFQRVQQKLPLFLTQSNHMVKTMDWMRNESWWAKSLTKVPHVTEQFYLFFLFSVNSFAKLSLNSDFPAVQLKRQGRNSKKVVDEQTDLKEKGEWSGNTATY